MFSYLMKTNGDLKNAERGCNLNLLTIRSILSLDHCHTFWPQSYKKYSEYEILTRVFYDNMAAPELSRTAIGGQYRLSYIGQYLMNCLAMNSLRAWM